jgi:chromate transporter
MRRSRWFGAALDGVNVGSLALMAVVTARIARSAIVDPWTVGILAVSALLLLRWRVNSAWLVLGGALVGLVIGS